MAAPRKVKAVVSRIRRFDGNITHYTLTAEIECRFKPGQFLHLALDPYDPSFNWPESRVFSIANAPNRENKLEILVSPKGSFTARMIRELQVGSGIWLKLPFGIFNFDAITNRNIVLLAGGTGISPFISLLRHLLMNSIFCQSISLYYGVRNPDLIIFSDFLQECIQKIKGFSYEIYCENGIHNEIPPLHTGILPVIDIVSRTSGNADSLYYLSGPRIMIEKFERELIHQGVRIDHVFYDKWE